MRSACSLLLGREAWSGRRAPCVTAVSVLPVAAGTPLIGGNRSLVNCETGSPLTALGLVEHGVYFIALGGSVEWGRRTPGLASQSGPGPLLACPGPTRALLMIKGRCKEKETDRQEKEHTGWMAVITHAHWVPAIYQGPGTRLCTL